MPDNFASIAHALFWAIPGKDLILVLHLLGLIAFAYIAMRRLRPLLAAQPDPRFDRPIERLGRVLQYWLAQWRHPRYGFAGTLHILIFAGFLLLASRVFTLLAMGVSDAFIPEPDGWLDAVRAYAATLVAVCMAVAIARRLLFRPERYPRAADAVFLLALIGVLMLADGVFEGSRAAHAVRVSGITDGPPAASLPWIVQRALSAASPETLRYSYLGAYLVHEVVFFFLLCYRPFGIQFHVETSLFSTFFAKLDRGTVKPVRWGVAEDRIDGIEAFGVKRVEDFTWKHILDLYSCADCGRCAEQCPSHAVGRPLAPRTLTVRLRDHVYGKYPVFGASRNGVPLVGGVIAEDEIWSCTTCGACEAECPLLIEHIDKIVDLRRGLIDGGKAPQSLHKPLKSLETRGNPYGKPEKKRGEWAEGLLPIVNGGPWFDTLYFVDSITSYDERMASIGRSAARILTKLGMNAAMLGPKERDSGHEVRRFGEETLFFALRDHNTEAILASGVSRIVATDPHAVNALRHDYRGLPPVDHISQTIARAVRCGQLRLNPVNGDVYAYHDPCYLGRHNGVYDDPRDVLDSVPNLKRVEMQRSRDRSFCCGGGGLALFYEPKEEERMGVRRVRMAAEAGANVIVTACPYCMANLEDAIKVAGLEGRMTAIDLAELVDRQMAIS